MAHILLGDAGLNFLVSRPIFFFSSHVGQAYDLVAVCSRARLHIAYIPTCWRANILLASAQYEETQWGTTW